MAYIHQKNSINPTVVVNATKDDLTQDPSIVEHPELFEIVDGEPPMDASSLDYISQNQNQ